MADGSGPGWTLPPLPPGQTPPPGGANRGLWLLLGLVAASVVVVGGLAMTLLDRGPSPGPPPTTSSGRTEVAVPDPPSRPSPRVRARRPGRPVDLNALARQVAAIRELPLRRRLRSRVLSTRALAGKVSEIAFTENDPKQVEADERLLVALRLAPPDVDLLAIVEALYREQILGLYVPKERTLYIRGGAARGSAAQRMTSAHEITHALQDQSYDLVALQKAAEDDADRALALLSLIEGDAVLTQQLWSNQHQTQQQREEALAQSRTGGEALAQAPPYLQASLFFPYQRGSEFVATLFRDGGYGAVNRAFAAPPTTSEQILHPEKFLAGEDAVAVAAPRRPGPRWKRSAAYTFGEFDLAEMLAVIGSGTADEAAAGWGGGEVRSWVRGRRTVVAAALAFDSAGDADEACDALGRWYVEVADARPTGAGEYEGDRDHMALRCAPRSVRFALADDARMARRLTRLE